MAEKPRKGVATILAGIPILGAFGADKYYVGATGLGIAMTISSILIIGLIWTIPYAGLSTLALVLAILFGMTPFLYPKVDWAPTTKTDKIIAWIVVGLYVLGIVVSIIASLVGPKRKEYYEEEEKKKRGCGCG